ncbi:MAG: hypothetical protein Q8K72_15420, partial [Acidimicrobiales bacterium]|nr:hypothetical protein [Acidimicrobiales bacterium]
MQHADRCAEVQGSEDEDALEVDSPRWGLSAGLRCERRGHPAATDVARSRRAATHALRMRRRSSS